MAQELNGFPDEMLEKCSQVPAAESWGWAEESGAGAGRAEGMTTPGQREHVVPSVRTQPPSPLPPAAHTGGWYSMEAVAPGQGWGAVACHLFLISSASVRSIPFPSFIVHIFA